MLARPKLTSQAALWPHVDATAAHEFFHTAERDFASAEVQLPPSYEAKLGLLEAFSPKTLNDDQAVKDWIDTFMMWPTKSTSGIRAQHIAPVNNRLPAYRAITHPCC